MSEYIDEAGHALGDYARPSVTVDTVVLTVHPAFNELQVVIDRTPSGQDALPGTFLHENETLVEAANRALASKVGVRGLSPVQLHVFDDPGRDPRGWVISVAHIAVVPIELLDDVGLCPVAEATNLAFDHDEMLVKALERVRREYAESPDPWNLLDTFTLKELRQLHEAIDPDTPLRDSFRRLMQPLLVDTGEMSSGSVGKPSRIWRKETEAERIQRKYAKYERPQRVMTANTSRSSSAQRKPEADMYSEDFMALGSVPLRSDSTQDRTARTYALEIEWENGQTTRHENLSPTQAGLRLKEFADEARAAWESLPPLERPRVARIVTPYGDTEQDIVFS